MNEDTKKIDANVGTIEDTTEVPVVQAMPRCTGAAAMTLEELIATLAPEDIIAMELCNVARMASAMVADVFPDATIDTQTLKLAEECDEMYQGVDTLAGLVDVAIVALQLIYDYKSMIGLCTLRGALQERTLQTEEDWKEFLSACHDKISTNYMRNALKFWAQDPSSVSVPVYERSLDYAE